MHYKELFFSHQIAITSLCGVGSSTLMRISKEKLKGPYRFVSGGDIMRVFAEGAGMSMEDFAEHNRIHPENGVDLRLDRQLSGFSCQNYVIAEARLAHFLFPGAFKVNLVCDIEIAAQRRSEEKSKATLHIRQGYEKRNEDDRLRYESLYGPDCMWTSDQFDLVIDTGVTSPDQVFQQIMAGHETWRRQKQLEERIVTDLYDPGFFQNLGLEVETASQ